MTENRVFFIINKYSGSGFQSAIEGRIIDACAQLKLEATIEYTLFKGHATELAHRAVTEGFTRVFAMGGDGTVNEVARALVHTSTSLGIIPMGSGNGLARHLQIPLSVHHSLQLLNDHNVIAMDTFLINDHLSVNVSGIGFDGLVAGKFGKNGKRGLIGYCKLIMKEFYRFKEFKAEVILDGKILQRQSFILALANSSQFGNNAIITPFASVCDQLIDVCFVKKVPILHAIGFAWKLFTGHMHRSAYVEILQGKQVTIKFGEPMPFHIDGESMEPTKDFNIVLSPASLRMIVPDKSGLRC